jgi:hypothetical protein
MSLDRSRFPTLFRGISRSSANRFVPSFANKKSTAATRRQSRQGLSRFESLESRQPLAVNVTTLDDGGTGSLRDAIDLVNKAGVADTIVFNNLGAGTIALKTALPTLTNPAGTTFSFGGTTTAIILDGVSALAANGLTIGAGANNVSLNALKLTLTHFDNGLKFLGNSTNSLISGLTITDNTNGIVFDGGSLSGTKIVGNTITLNTQSGILAAGGVTGLAIGGTTAGSGNTIAYNGDGLSFQPGTHTGTVVTGNTITGNTNNGVLLGTSGGALSGLVIGGSSTAAANTISFNEENGVKVAQGSYSGTVIQGNTITSNGGYGVQLSPSGQSLTDLTVGGTTTGQGNTIASNAADGIGVFGGSYTNTAVQGNTIQYNQNNGVSINLFAGGGAFSGLLLGGGTAAAGNTITSNGLDGVQVNAGTYTSTFVRANTITANGRHGVNFFAPFGEKLTGFQLGGTTSSLGNTITDNAASGLAASKGDYSTTAVLGNTISTNKTGISLTNVQNLAIGGVATAFKNTINSNAEAGLFATGTLTGTTFQGNSLTTNPLGVSLQDAQGLSLGGAAAGAGNAIVGGTTGVRAVGNLSSSVISGNAITGQTTGIQMINTTGASSATPFFVGGAATTVGNGAGNYVASTVHGLYAAGVMNHTTVAGNIFSASAAGGNAMVLENATGLTVGGSAAGTGNTLTAALGNGLWAAGHLVGSGFYKNTLTASRTGAVLINATNFLFGVANNAALGNIVQYNQVGVNALGNCTGSGVCYTTWLGNGRKVQNTARGLVVFPKA